MHVNVRNVVVGRVGVCILNYVCVLQVVKRELKRLHIDGCRYNEKLNAETGILDTALCTALSNMSFLFFTGNRRTVITRIFHWSESQTSAPAKRRPKRERVFFWLCFPAPRAHSLIPLAAREIESRGTFIEPAE